MLERATPDGAMHPYHQPGFGPTLPKSRKDQILIFTILGWAACGIFSIIAYQMASADLEQMASGMMDDADLSTVSLCKTLAMVHLVLFVVSLVGMCCLFGISASSGGYWRRRATAAFEEGSSQGHGRVTTVTVPFAT